MSVVVDDGGIIATAADDADDAVAVAAWLFHYGSSTAGSLDECRSSDEHEQLTYTQMHTQTNKQANKIPTTSERESDVVASWTKWC